MVRNTNHPCLRGHSLHNIATLILVIATTTLSEGAGRGAGNRDSTGARNILILADDLGWADTSLYGHTRLYQTPYEHIEDRMAQEAVAFMEEHGGKPFFRLLSGG
jgi:hypothetical protein